MRRTEEVLAQARAFALAREWTLRPDIKHAWRALDEAIAYASGWWVPCPPRRPDVTRDMWKWAEEVENGLRRDGTDVKWLATRLADFVDAHLDDYGQWEDF